MNNLDNTKITILLKLALEYNASIIAQASLLFNQELNERDAYRAIREFKELGDSYQRDINEVLQIKDENIST